MRWLFLLGLLVSTFLSVFATVMYLGNPRLGNLSDYALRYFPWIYGIIFLFAIVVAFHYSIETRPWLAVGILATPLVISAVLLEGLQAFHPGVLTQAELNAQKLSKLDFPPHQKSLKNQPDTESIVLEYPGIPEDRMTLYVPKTWTIAERLDPKDFPKTLPPTNESDSLSIVNLATSEEWNRRLAVRFQPRKKWMAEHFSSQPSQTPSSSKKRWNPAGFGEELAVSLHHVNYNIYWNGASGNGWTADFKVPLQDWNTYVREIGQIRASLRETF